MWKNEFLKISNKHAPFVERRLKSRSNPWITPNIVKLMYRRDFLHKRAVTLKDESAWDEYKNMRNAVNREVNTTKRIYYDNVVTLNRNEPKILWRKINDLVREKKSSNSNVHDISASEFNRYFSTIGKKVSSKLPKQGMPKWKNPASIYSFTFKNIDVAAVHGDLHSLDGDSGNDVLQLDAKLLRMSADVICRTLTHLYNISLSSKIIPGEWKLARITPIYKGSGDVHRETNYRPISVLSHVAKIFERNVHEQIVNYLEHHCFITPYQSAYLKKHSTVTCLHRVIDDMCENIDDGLVCGVCFLDIEKCFDTIDHDILLQKLKWYGIDGHELDWFKSYLYDRKQCVRVDNITSDVTSCPIGVPQGSILGPILFLLYVNDFAQYIENQNCNIFADDAMIYSFGRDIPEMESNLQCALNSLTPWYSANRLSISAQKSAVMLIGKQSQVKNSILAVSINGDPLEQVCSTKYLGVTVDNTLSWDSQCDNLCFKLAGKIAVLRRIRSFVKTETLKLLYEKTIQPVMDYACSVWCNTKKSNINKLQRVQNYAARIITGNFDYINTQSIDVLRSLRWATVQERCDYFTAVLMFKAICGLTPMYMTDNIVMAAETHDRDTRLSNSNDVNIPPHNSDVLKRSFIYNGSVIWNKLPDEIRMATDVSDFKWRYKCLILNPLFENEWCPFVYKVIENCVHFIRHFIPMF